LFEPDLHRAPLVEKRVYSKVQGAVSFLTTSTAPAGAVQNSLSIEYPFHRFHRG
jgi:hypothetical protein